MFKRARWMAFGYTLGASSAYYAAKRVRRAAQRLTPNEMASRVGSTVGGTARHVQAAVAQGRDTMRHREAELRRSSRLDAEAARLRSR